MTLSTNLYSRYKTKCLDMTAVTSPLEILVILQREIRRLFSRYLWEVWGVKPSHQKRCGIGNLAEDVNQSGSERNLRSPPANNLSKSERNLHPGHGHVRRHIRGVRSLLFCSLRLCSTSLGRCTSVLTRRFCCGLRKR